jgi:hypothetical protein
MLSAGCAGLSNNLTIKTKSSSTVLIILFKWLLDITQPMIVLVQDGTILLDLLFSSQTKCDESQRLSCFVGFNVRKLSFF